MNPRRRARWVVIALLTVAAFAAPAEQASGQDSGTAEIEKYLAATYDGKVVTLRTPLAGKLIRYDANGRPETNGAPGGWAMDGNVMIGHVRLRSQSLEFEGSRVYLAYDPDEKKLRGLAGAPVRIEVELPQGPVSLAGLRGVCERLHFPLDVNLATLVPEYWKPILFNAKGEWADWAGPSGSLNARPSYGVVKESVTPPEGTYEPDPPYTPAARSHKLEGLVKVEIMIDVHGRVADVILLGRSLGDGLDQRAIETVRTWRFKPATRDGVPVAVPVRVEVSFRLVG
jgi:TonB family protein